MSRGMVLGIFLILCTSLTFGQEQTAKKCPQCGRLETRKNANYCILDGTKLITTRVASVWQCSQCQEPIDKGGQFCHLCGSQGVLVQREVAEEVYRPPAVVKPASARTPVEATPVSPGEATPVSPGEVTPASTAPVIPVPNDGLVDCPGSLVLEEILLEDMVRSEVSQILSREGKTFTRRQLLKSPLSARRTLSFYQKQDREASLLSYDVSHVFLVTKIKFRRPQAQTEIALCVIKPESTAEEVERASQQVIVQLREEAKPLEEIDQQLEHWQGLLAKGEMTQLVFDDRAESLIKRRQIILQSSAYWELKALVKLVELRSPIVITSKTFALPKSPAKTAHAH